MTVARAVETGVGMYARALNIAAQTCDADAGGDAAARQSVLDAVSIPPDFGALAVTDATGRVIASTHSLAPIDDSVAAYDFFQAQRDRPARGDASRPFMVSAPFQSPAFGGAGSGEWTAAFSLALFGRDARFAGIVFGTLKLQHFHDLADRLQLGQLGEVTLLREDGVVLARSHGGAQAGAHGPPPFGMASPQSRSGRRLFSYSRVGTLPLVVTVALSVDEVLAAWRRQAGVIGAVTMTLLASLLAATLALRRELARRLEAEAAASRSAARYRLLADHSSDVILRIDPAGRLAYVSPSALDVVGRTPDALTGQPWRDLAVAEDAAALDAARARLTQGEERATVQFRCACHGAQTVWLEASLRLVVDAGGAGHPGGAADAGGAGGAIVNIRDITWRKQAEEEMAAAARHLAVLASTDGLTGLANRRCFDETLNREWRRAARAMSELSVLLVDADWFKAYNDRYGHQGGDEALRAIAACIGEAIKRPGDLGARYGGEEFAIILPDASEAGALTVASKLRTRLAARAVIHDGAPSGLLSVSIGIATMPAHSDGDPADLVAAADAALYDAKKAGRDRVAVRPLSLLTTETVQRELSLSEIGLATGDT